MEEYEALSKKLFTDNERVLRFITSVVTRTVKFETKIPIDED